MSSTTSWLTTISKTRSSPRPSSSTCTTSASAPIGQPPGAGQAGCGRAGDSSRRALPGAVWGSPAHSKEARKKEGESRWALRRGKEGQSLLPQSLGWGQGQSRQLCPSGPGPQPWGVGWVDSCFFHCSVFRCGCFLLWGQGRGGAPSFLGCSALMAGEPIVHKAHASFPVVPGGLFLNRTDWPDPREGPAKLIKSDSLD